MCNTDRKSILCTSSSIWESLSQHVLQSKCLCVCVITVCHFVCLSVTESLCVRMCLPCVVAVCTAFSVTSRNHKSPTGPHYFTAPSAKSTKGSARKEDSHNVVSEEVKSLAPGHPHHPKADPNNTEDSKFLPPIVK